MSIFKDIELSWAGRDYSIPAKRVTGAIATIENVITLVEFLYSPKFGIQGKPVVTVLDNGPIHTSKAPLEALAARAHWLTVAWLPKYAPKLNNIEVVWQILKLVISPTRPSLAPKSSTRPSTKPSQS